MVVGVSLFGSLLILFVSVLLRGRLSPHLLPTFVVDAESDLFISPAGAVRRVEPRRLDALCAVDFDKDIVRMSLVCM